MCFRHASGLCPKWKRNCSLAFLDREEPNREKPKKRKSHFISESHVFWKSSKLILPLTYKFISMSSHFNHQAILFVNHHPCTQHIGHEVARETGSVSLRSALSDCFEKCCSLRKWSLREHRSLRKWVNLAVVFQDAPTTGETHQIWTSHFTKRSLSKKRRTYNWYEM